MCGIAGTVSTSATSAATERVEATVQNQLCRGPDHQAVQVICQHDPAVVFGHDRLSILDLSAAANQPFWTEDRRYCLTFNGEIYNYCELRDDLRRLGRRFRTDSDTEVLIEAFAAWGVESITRFNGMFAFAIADTRQGTVWLVRDRFGVKPLFYTRPTPQEVWFASSAETINLQLKLVPEYEYLSDGIASFVYEDGSSRSQYKGLMAVEPGCYVEIVRSGGCLSCETKRYYDLRARVASRQAELEGKSENDLVTTTEALLRDAVRLRLRSDVPVGVSLSGGLDSSLVACLAAQEGARIVGVCFGHPDRRDTEGPLVREIAAHLGLEVHYVWPDADRMRHTLWETLKAQESPFPGLSVVAQYLVFNQARVDGLKVMLGGQGGDEAFMGYRKYLYMTMLRREDKSGAVSDLIGIGKVFARELTRLAQTIGDVGRYIGPRRPVLDLPGTGRDLGLSGSRHARWRQLRDVTELSLPTLLRYEDRNSMGNSIESRLPFMDYRVIETGLALPDRLKVRKGYGKWILRRIANGLLPPSVTMNRLKVGFDALSSEWIRAGVGNDIRIRLRHATGSGSHPPNHLRRNRFGDHSLSRDESAFGEALTAIWLSQQGEDSRVVCQRLANA